MASRFKQNDTAPALRGRAENVDGALSLTEADSIKVILSTRNTVVTGTAEVIDPPESGEVDGEQVEFNWKYDWQEGDLAVAGTYKVELEITWNAASDPPLIETVPNAGYGRIVVVKDLG